MSKTATPTIGATDEKGPETPLSDKALPNAASPHPNARRRCATFLSTLPLLSLNILSLLLLAVVAVFVHATYNARRYSDQKLPLSGLMKLDYSTTLTILRVSLGVLSAITTMNIRETFVNIQWILMRPPEGLSYHSLLALSPTTETMGLMALMVRTGMEKAAMMPKLWTMLRASLSLISWLAGLVLFFNTSIITVYDTTSPYPVTAGVGPFDASLVDPFFEQVVDTGRARLQLAPIYYLVANPLLSTTISSTHGSNTRCPSGADECVSVLLSGGLEMARAQGSNSSLAGNGTREDVHEPPSENDFPMAKLDDVQSLQVDYSWPASDAFEPEDCQVPTNTSVKLCVSEVGDGSLRAAIFDCPWPKDESKPRCTERSNYSIAGLEDLTVPVLRPFTNETIQPYRRALSWLLEKTAADDSTVSYIGSYWTHDGILEQNFQSVLAFPAWLLNANNWGNERNATDDDFARLTSEFHTTAAHVRPYEKLRVDPSMFVLFLVLQGLAMGFIWTGLVWAWVRERKRGDCQRELVSAFPLFDMAFKTRVEMAAAAEEGLVVRAGSREVVGIVKGARVLTKID